MVAALACTAALVACASEPVEVSADEYLADLQAICADTSATLDALPDPPTQISVVDFATNAASALANEAERARALTPPDTDTDPDGDADADADADHRAFVLNTDQQAAAWRSIAAAPDDIGDATTRIGELVRGRNDLADALGAPACRRGDV